MILVTGATGNLGSEVIQHLLKKLDAHKIAAFAKDENKSFLMKESGVDVRIGNYNDIDSLDNAMKGIEKVLLISGTDMEKRLEHHKNVIDAARRAGVKHIAYTGFSIRDINTSNLRDAMKVHFETESYLKSSSVAYTFLRDTYYADILPLFIGDSEAVLSNGIVFPAGNGKVPFALREEMGEAFANVLLTNGHENKTYNIGNVESFSFTDIANTLSKISGKTITYTDLEPLKFAEMLTSFDVPEYLIGMSVALGADIRDGQHEIISNDLEILLGRKPTDLRKMLEVVYKF